MLLAAGQAGAAHCLTGIGGSATNDGGFGMARALGWVFRDESGKPIEQWTRLDDLALIESPTSRAWPGVTVASDVQNLLLGVDGATWVYGSQKGMRPEDFAKANACLGRLAKVTAETLGSDFSATPGAGAAGGLGFGLMAFAGATIESGFEVFAKATELEAKVGEADFVVTAEGAIDEQTLMGKGTGQVAALCRRLGKPCIGLAGQLALGQAEVEAADLPAGLLEAAHLDSVRLAKGSPVIDQRIGELELRANTGVSIVGIERDGERIVNPGPEETLLEGDRLLLLGEDTKLPKAKAELNG